LSLVAAILSLFGIGAALLWIRAHLRGLSSARDVPRLEETAAAPLPYAVVIPARDEDPAPTVGDLLRQDAPPRRVVVVDDRSEPPVPPFPDPRVERVRIDHLPAGWLGKVHALARGLEHLPEDAALVLLTDADVRFGPGALSRATAFCRAHRLEHLCLLPDYEDRGGLLEAAIHASEGLLLSGRRAHEVGRPDSSAYLGLGAFMLVRREALEAAGGLEPLRLAVLDDMALARRLRDAGARARVRRAGSLVRVEWYGRLGGLVRGLEKTFLAAARFSPRRAAGLGAGLVILGLGPPLTAAFGALPGARGVGALALFTLSVSAVVRSRRAGRPLRRALLAPLGLVVLGVAGLRAAWVGARRGALEWRETRYPLAELRDADAARRAAPPPAPLDPGRPRPGRPP
jgi:hypothetical protein